jgi:hypothetical protein
MGHYIVSDTSNMRLRCLCFHNCAVSICCVCALFTFKIYAPKPKKPSFSLYPKIQDMEKESFPEILIVLIHLFKISAGVVSWK